LDVATGSGDIPLGLYQRAQQCGLKLAITGVDISPRAVEAARERAGLARLEIAFEVLDVLKNDLPTNFDVIVSSLFLHHLEDLQATRLLDQMHRAARRLGLVNDLVRSGSNLLLVHLATRLCTRSRLVHVDGPRSIRAAFTPQELSLLAAASGIENAVITRHWPCRMLLQWHKET
jgi:SAM-dependent methyltransferase